jgi:plasmid maintenance system antidote protein VapI
MAEHVEEFAARLRELNERSGRSYGALATRLHVSTSTLHRYCNGTAVPSEYAPVERFARVCGATPEELVALHQLWLLANAERRRETGAGRVSTAAATEPEPASAPNDGKPEVPEPGSSTPQGVDADADADAVRPARPARRRRPKLAVSAVVAAAAILIPLAVWAAPGSDGTNTSTGSPATTPSNPLATPSTTAALPAPLTVNVLSDNWESECGQWFYATQSPSKVHPPPGLPDVGLWADPLGAVPAGHLRLQLTAQSVAGQPSVILHTIYTHIMSAKPAPKGFGYTMGSGCGGGLDPASFAIDLDAADPLAHAVAGDTGNGTTAVSDFPFQVSGSDPQVLDVDASTAGQDVSWYLELVWSSGDRQGTLRIDDNGKPFRTIGLNGDPLYFYDGTKWAPTTSQ